MKPWLKIRNQLYAIMVETWWNEWMVGKNQPIQPAQEQVEKKSTDSTQNNETNGFLRWIRWISWFSCAETNRPLIKPVTISWELALSFSWSSDVYFWSLCLALVWWVRPLLVKQTLPHVSHWNVAEDSIHKIFSSCVSGFNSWDPANISLSITAKMASRSSPVKKSSCLPGHLRFYYMDHPISS